MPTSNHLRTPASMRFTVLILFCVLSLLTACSSGPDPIRYGSDSCDFCRMGITDKRYGTELVSVQGKQYKFDSIECLAGYLAGERISPTDVGTLWVTCFDKPGELADATQVSFIRSKEILSPMGMNFTAYTTADAANTALEGRDGTTLPWSNILKAVIDENFVH